ncbi:MAG: hypothetical protein RSD46_06290, partial [Oscillospiraceae bacterium]
EPSPRGKVARPRRGVTKEGCRSNVFSPCRCGDPLSPQCSHWGTFPQGEGLSLRRDEGLGAAHSLKPSPMGK